MAANSIFFFRPSWATNGPNQDKSQNGTVFGHGESIGEDRKSLSFIVSEFQRGCSWLPYANIWQHCSLGPGGPPISVIGTKLKTAPF